MRILVSESKSGRVRIDYENCKGCMICLTECPLKAISQSGERGLQ